MSRLIPHCVDALESLAILHADRLMLASRAAAKVRPVLLIIDEALALAECATNVEAQHSKRLGKFTDDQQ